ncbi:hypothetical protein M5689_003672 [Euphorbia peplus]|nr:hypothetical protein M5689_003672 [Euphorbia peplus]
MGRKPKNSKIAHKSHQQESENPCQEGSEVEPEIDNASLASMKDKHGTGRKTLPQDKLEVQLVNHSKVPSRKKVKKSTLPPRRSVRLQSAVVATENHYIEQIIEEITVSDSEKENEPMDDDFPKPSMDDKDIHNKIDYLVDLIERYGKSFFGGSSSVGEVTYKSLYLDSQKKIEALMEENSQLGKKLEYAHGKIEIYEKGDHVSYAMLEKVKDVLFCSNGIRSTEVAEGALECKSAKRKRGPN